MDDAQELAGTKQPLIISPEEAKKRITAKPGIRDGGKSGHNIGRAEAVSIACQIGQQVYDQLREEHAATMANLQEDLAGHFKEIKEVAAMNILDIQSRSFSYRVRRDFAVDCKRIGEWVKTRYELALAWLELHGLREAPPEAETPRGGLYADPQSAVAGSIASENTEPIEKAFDVDVDDIIESPDIASSLELHVGAPTELPGQE
jgi:hypothetical protein